MKVGRLDDPVWSEPPPPARPKRRHLRWLVAGVVLGLVSVEVAGALLMRTAGTSKGLDACAAVTRAELRSALSRDVGPGDPGVPDGDQPGATRCSYGRSVTVFATGVDATAFFEQQLDAPGAGKRDIGGRGYRAFAYEDPPRFQTFVLLKHGEYVNVLLYDSPAGAAERLAQAVAARLP